MNIFDLIFKEIIQSIITIIMIKLWKYLEPKIYNLYLYIHRIMINNIDVTIFITLIFINIGFCYNLNNINQLEIIDILFNSNLLLSTFIKNKYNNLGDYIYKSAHKNLINNINQKDIDFIYSDEGDDLNIKVNFKNLFNSLELPTNLYFNLSFTDTNRFRNIYRLIKNGILPLDPYDLFINSMMILYGYLLSLKLIKLN
uniref:Uncharacterized protein n=1 Tax=Amanita phalloides TaxID=67723 RepID=A0A5Q0N2D0_AMAPH|nr:hypothetical protein [Amanita phalloides]QFZ98672.1 hypothetical protein [Amanita phalloides]WLF85177.1 hypothetical protein [Amanita phalloides]